MGPTGGPPAAPTSFAVQLNGLVATLSWSAPAGALTGYALEAGTFPGAANLAVVNLGPQTTFISPALSPGSYYLRVKAVNAAGIGPPSNEVLLTVPGVPAAPTDLSVQVAGRVATLTWTASAGAVIGYLLEAGTVPGATNLATLPLGAQTTFISPPLPTGVFYVRVKARNAVGTSAASNEVQINIPPP
jgi:large repetitive protein